MRGTRAQKVTAIGGKVGDLNGMSAEKQGFNKIVEI